MDVTIGYFRKEVELSGVSDYYIDNPEGLYWSIYTVFDEHFELRSLRKHMVENGERILLTKEQIKDFKERKEKEKKK